LTNTLRRNLEQLPHEIRTQVEKAIAHHDLIDRRAKDGERVIGLRRADRDVFFHSRYAPLREAERIAADIPPNAFVVAFGFGAGHHLTPLLQTGHRVVAVEPDPRLLRAALERFDFAEAFATNSLCVATGNPDEVEQIIRERFVPGLDERLVAIELPGRVSSDQETFAPYRASITRLFDDYAGDVSTQAHFGKRWMSNSLGNLVYLTASRTELLSLPRVGGATACVVAAGPSLESQIGWIEKRRSKMILLAVDTALPVLIAHGISPDLVVSIDCQVASYHHYLSASPVTTPAAIELSAPGALLRAARRIIPIGSSHPFHRFLRGQSLPVATIATGSGNVTGTTVQLARSIGAGSVVLAGVDSSYPGGNLYPRGSYAHRYFQGHSLRIAPAEGLMRAFLWTRGDVEPEEDRWMTPQLRSYHGHLQRLLLGLQIPVYELEGAGWPLGFPAPEDDALSPPSNAPPREARALNRALVRRALERFLNLISQVDDRESLVKAFFHESSHPAAASILPVLLTISKQEPATSHDQRIQMSIGWVRDRVAQASRDVGR